ncbi:phosphoenolpyruvate synthase [Synechocystis sp. PCC 6803]|uniref:Phosphoenolpyruvate synthase n=1 Tax=Synechocystis sp. (strain ATCC 27184 / PCC 6803 / Kazusa) TaxID=1111708 RepID=PPSA_SYNY3|nr:MULTISPECIES: pyruvate, water dikinase [unclassified Synechocystis]Q55905.1 RecName: Full=Phosphoenolpyruvate synthase; Short=PEP synthase; AltName: Full=Pyruvate, water dikinase [Synechocystis sp. PCC 6803 substr. Kazusa]BAM53735.1 phosphoenolpyruvate synthase [Synechocystis sp. PCC 6803] [Bacillus subtilis BEST7613]AGF52959.1 phosphoenolpyruvate synthase [Synechocystis sp. PCC 6803]ALJ68852.1 phosphoenolpyruvate synthase [Synechocystis sp. PCC 6803]AVP90714.1 phosphoenolpyruvate synthase 
MVSSVVEKTSVAHKETALILWFEEVGTHDVGLVGGKNSSLGEMIQQLTNKGVNVPSGFATTAYAYRYFIQEAGLEQKLRDLFTDLDVNDMANLQERGHLARQLILDTPFPQNLQTAIAEAYGAMCERYGQKMGRTGVDVAVRSSATAEDLPEASFAGQQETYLNVHSLSCVLESCHKCFASLFTDRAISYRHHNGFDHFAVALSVGVQKMVRSDLATSGVMFSIDTETGFKNAALITAAYGLGENVVQGAVNPDEYFVFKPTLKEGFKPILEKRLGSKAIKMVYDVGGSKLTKNVEVAEPEREKYCINDEEILQLARWACIIEDHYSGVRGVYTPMDIEWAKDGQTGELFIVQARPETVQSQKSANVIKTYELKDHSQVLATGRSVGAAIGQGKAQVIRNVSQINQFRPGEVLITNRTDPDWEPIMKQASAIVTNQGGKTCHAAIIAREMGIPAIVGCGDATDTIKTGEDVTICCSEGDEGSVYSGILNYEVHETELSNLPRTKTQILMNVGNPEQAFGFASYPADGVGLARLEFIIANHIKAHPLALMKFDELEDPLAKAEIAELTKLYAGDRPRFFVDKLAHGIAMIAAAFYPKPVVVRMSDFKSNEYANLLGGRQFEPKEENPMIGWRGASRYYDPNYREAYALECQALKRVRDEMGLTNVIPMIPFCRTPDEGRKVIAEMAKHGLKQGKNGLEIYVMCELPSNVILADEFSEVFDGFSIGSNDLTQLTLGLDRDSSLVAHLFDERNLGVKRMVKMAIETAKANGRKIGICGQAPSDYPEFAEFLVELGIDSISLNPDSVLKTVLRIAEVEKALG